MSGRGMSSPRGARPGALTELVVCSLKEWDEVWNRNNFLTDALLRRNQQLRVLFVEPPADPLHALSRRQKPAAPLLRTISADRRLRVLRPLKLLPRRLGSVTDAFLCRQVRLAARALRFSRPTLWINDVTYAPLIHATRWPSLYDVSDDWLLAPFAPRELERLRRLDALALKQADEVVVCSPALAESRGASRPVSLVRNAVDIQHFRRPRPRPVDLPKSPVAVYAGTAHDARIDVELVSDLARTLPNVTFAFVGPNALEARSRRRLKDLPNVLLLGPRPYRDVPAYLQHADVVVVPHRLSPFMESLDPIKAYECLAIESPTVATPVAGFREYSDSLIIASRDVFPTRVVEVLAGAGHSKHSEKPPEWEDRAVDFEAALRRTIDRGNERGKHTW